MPLAFAAVFIFRRFRIAAPLRVALCMPPPIRWLPPLPDTPAPLRHFHISQLIAFSPPLHTPLSPFHASYAGWLPHYAYAISDYAFRHYWPPRCMPRQYRRHAFAMPHTLSRLFSPPPLIIDIAMPRMP